MLIISQDEENIVNFDNVTRIKISDYIDCATIFACYDKDNIYDLGTYRSKARAKEVLKDIIKAINGKNFVEYNESTLNIHSIEQKAFYMPKE